MTADDQEFIRILRATERAARSLQKGASSDFIIGEFALMQEEFSNALHQLKDEVHRHQAELSGEFTFTTIAERDFISASLEDLQEHILPSLYRVSKQPCKPPYSLSSFQARCLHVDRLLASSSNQKAPDLTQMKPVEGPISIGMRIKISRLQTLLRNDLSAISLADSRGTVTTLIGWQLICDGQGSEKLCSLFAALDRELEIVWRKAREEALLDTVVTPLDIPSPNIYDQR